MPRPRRGSRLLLDLRGLELELDASADSAPLADQGAGATPSGKTMLSLTINRRDGDRHNWQRQKRDGQEGVTASWHDRKGATRKNVTVGKDDGAKKLRKVYPDEASARRAATAERDRLKRAPETLDLKLALGQANAIPEARVKVAGYKAQIDAATWLIAEVTHRLDKAGGFRTDVKMETAP